MRTERILECEHVRVYSNCPPSIEERVWCSICEDMKRIISSKGYWHATCVKQCRTTFTRKKPEDIRNLIRGHLLMNRKHEMQLYQYGSKDVYTVKLTDETGKVTTLDTQDSDLLFH